MGALSVAGHHFLSIERSDAPTETDYSLTTDSAQRAQWSAFARRPTADLDLSRVAHGPTPVPSTARRHVRSKRRAPALLPKVVCGLVSVAALIGGVTYLAPGLGLLVGLNGVDANANVPLPLAGSDTLTSFAASRVADAELHTCLSETFRSSPEEVDHFLGLRNQTFQSLGESNAENCRLHLAEDARTAHDCDQLWRVPVGAIACYFTEAQAREAWLRIGEAERPAPPPGLATQLANDVQLLPLAARSANYTAMARLAPHAPQLTGYIMTCATDSPDWEVRNACYSALERYGPAALDVWGKALAGPNASEVVQHLYPRGGRSMQPLVPTVLALLHQELSKKTWDARVLRRILSNLQSWGCVARVPNALQSILNMARRAATEPPQSGDRNAHRAVIVYGLGILAAAGSDAEQLTEQIVGLLGLIDPVSSLPYLVADCSDPLVDAIQTRTAAALQNIVVDRMVDNETRRFSIKVQGADPYHLEITALEGGNSQVFDLHRPRDTTSRGWPEPICPIVPDRPQPWMPIVPGMRQTVPRWQMSQARFYVNKPLKA